MQPTHITNATSAKALNHLIETLKDGQDGFAAAAQDCSDSKLKELFGQYSQQRSDFAMELQACVEGRGEEAEETGSMAGAMHRGWINLKSSVSSRDSLAILEECERGEDHALTAFREALASNELGSTETTVARQLEEIKRAHDQVKRLRDEYSSSK